MRESEPQQARLLEALAKYGRNLHSFMVLEPGLSVWSKGDAMVAYADRGGYWVAVGGPLCASEETLAVASAFREAARKKGRKVVFFGVTRPLVERLGGSFDALLVGLAAVWNPAQWQEVLGSSGKLRNRLSKARRAGVTVRLIDCGEVAPGTPLRKRFVEIVDSWAEQKALPPMGFMVTLELFQHAERRRYFVVESDGVVHGFAVCVPIYGRNGWLLEDMMIPPEAPAGCGESLVDAVMCQLRDEGAEVVSLGMVALAGLDAEQNSQNHVWLTRLLRVCARSMGWLYNLEGLYRFRDKMKPSAWEPVYIVSSGKVSFLTIRAILMAFANGWVPRFAARALGRWARQWLQRQAAPPSETPSPKPALDLPISLLAVACCTAMALAVVGAFQGWLPAWLSVGIGFVAAFAGFTPIHEAVHGNVSRGKVLNAAVGHLCSVLLTGAFRPYCFLHREHHLHTNVPTDDPDFWCGAGPSWAVPLRWLTQDIGYLRFYLSRWTTRPWLERADLVLCGSVYVALAVGAGLLHPSLFRALLLGWILPARLALFTLAATFSWLPHAPHQATTPYQATSVRSSPWLTWLLLGQNFHLVHHLDPSKPFYRLASIWKHKREDFMSHGAVDCSGLNKSEQT
ncbi:phosphatidylglycerol lysyltransferase domain-containing protein [Armatimonas rosea]|uniref:Fatty acid desaturase n=1 Tax=Armatimonas rosea TaxID=685828 RepID=A0A7W9W6G1_ARMRO|nr:phosphatidylglycerol lysyltransferase domain-containing protein [Armatimonas rosea]MBB6050131.1 fatty acid desaturase [Armatimonas rosea]